MKQLRVIFFLLFVTLNLQASKSTETQNNVERSINAVVRNKYFYKTNKIELSGTAGAMPLDSVVNHLLVGGRATWHFSDHFGWEIAHIQVASPSISANIKDIVTANSLSNVQFSQINLLATSNILLSPIYGKIRFFGNQVLYFDIYSVFGFGLANTKTIKLSSSAPVESTVRQGMDPVFDFGLGVKIFTGDALAILIDLRDYVTFTEVYSSRKPRSNFSVFAGLSFFIPNF
ncbi:MAG: outer membrane beta-barrel domain-containing protein [Deltaproteobacteria bacterium]|nr:outer membrane beta-barrel domain-containing protein [Deltaproteobacteria bacterium]